MITYQELYNMLNRFVDSCEEMRQVQQKYEKDGEADTMVRMNQIEKAMDEKIFKFRKWQHKNEKFFE